MLILNTSKRTEPNRNRHLTILPQVEQLITCLPLRCKHHGEGCSFETREEKNVLQCHESDCLFKRIPCPQTDCNIMVPLVNLEHHFVTHHHWEKQDCPGDGVFNVEWPVNLDSPSGRFPVHFPVTLFRSGCVMIFPVLYKRDNTYYVWLKMTANCDDEVVFSLKGPENRGCCFSGKYFGMETSTDDVVKNSDHTLTFTAGQARQCLTKNRRGRNVLKVEFKLMGELPHIVETELVDKSEGI